MATGGVFYSFAGVAGVPLGYGEHIWSTTTLNARAAAYMALSTDLVDEFGNGLTEPSGNGYARVNTSGNWTVADGEATNTTEILFPLPTGSWGTIQSLAIDVPSSGLLGLDRCFFATLSPSRLVVVGKRFAFPAGTLTIRTTPPTLDASSAFLDNGILNHALNAINFAKPAATYIALSTADPTKDGSGLAEPSGDNYARINVPQTSVGWTLEAPFFSGIVENADVVQFDLPEPGGWGTITHFAIMDAVTGGNMLWRAPLTTPTAVAAQRAPFFAAGALALEYNTS